CGGVSPCPVVLRDLGGVLVFAANADNLNTFKLWRSDGTAAGTMLVKDIQLGLLDEVVDVPGGLLFAADDGTNGTELWATDGTTAGTTLVKDINPGAGSSGPNAFHAVGTSIFFIANDGTHGQELWVTDGTPAGTTLVKDVNPGAADALNANFPS